MIADSKALERNNYFALMHIYRILLDTIAYTGNINVSRESTLIKIQDKTEQTGIYFRVYPDYREPIIICQISGDNVHGKFTFNRAIKTKSDVSFASQLLAIINDFNDEYGSHIEANKTDEYPIGMLKEFSNILILVLNEIKTKYQTSNDEFVRIVNKYPTTITFEEQEKYSMMSDEAIMKEALQMAELDEMLATRGSETIENGDQEAPARSHFLTQGDSCNPFIETTQIEISIKNPPKGLPADLIRDIEKDLNEKIKGTITTSSSNPNLLNALSWSTKVEVTQKDPLKQAFYNWNDPNQLYVKPPVWALDETNEETQGHQLSNYVVDCNSAAIISSDQLSVSYSTDSSVPISEPKVAKVIVLEGLDGAGKTSAMNVIGGYLAKKGKTSRIITSNTIGPASKAIRDLFVSRIAGEYKDDVISCLVSAYLISLMENEIFPAMYDVDYIIVDRLYHSTAAYQWSSMVGDILVEQMYKMLKIDLLIYLDIDYATSQQRKLGMNTELDHFEQASRYTFNSRAKAYLCAFNAYPAKSTVFVDAAQSKEDVETYLYKTIDAMEREND